MGSGSDLVLPADFPHGAEVLLCDFLIRDLRLPLAGGDGGMAEQLPNEHDLSPLLQQVGGKGVTETVTARADPRGRGIAGHLLLNRLDRQRPAEPFLVPEYQGSWHTGRASLQALPQAREGIGRQIDIASFAPFALLNVQGVLCPINVTHSQMGGFGHSQAASQHQQKQRAIYMSWSIRRLILSSATIFFSIQELSQSNGEHCR